MQSLTSGIQIVLNIRWFNVNTVGTRNLTG